MRAMRPPKVLIPLMLLLLAALSQLRLPLCDHTNSKKSARDDETRRSCCGSCRGLVGTSVWKGKAFACDVDVDVDVGAGHAVEGGISRLMSIATSVVDRACTFTRTFTLSLPGPRVCASTSPPAQGDPAPGVGVTCWEYIHKTRGTARGVGYEARRAPV
jgi:hypothetical protein